MIQFNLLPDVKLQYIKARNMKRLVMLASAVVTGISLTIMIILFIGVHALQRGHLNRLRADIDRDSKKLQQEQDLNKILTVQHQLNSLNGLHEAKPAAERLGSYLSQLTPGEVTISNLSVDFGTNAMTIEGASGQFKFINEFIDTLKFTKYKHDDQTTEAFSNVVLASFTRNDEDPETPATYQITLQFDPLIFDNTKTVSLEIPNTITTRSTTERPQPLFQAQEGEQ